MRLLLIALALQPQLTITETIPPIAGDKEVINFDESETDSVRKESNGNSLETAASRMLESKFSACDNKTATEIGLEDLINDLNSQLLSDETLLNQTESTYVQSRDVYYDKKNIANSTFDQLVLDAQDADLKGNSTMDNFDAFFNAYDAIDIFDVHYNNTIESLNATLELLISQNETYIQSLEGGDPVAIEEAASNLNATVLALNDIVGAFNETHSYLKEQLDNADVELQQASLSMKLYSDSWVQLNNTSLLYNSTQFELSEAKDSMKMREAEAESAWNSTLKKYKDWNEGMDALETERDAAFQTCLSDVSNSSSFSSRKLRSRQLTGRRLKDVCDCTTEQNEVNRLMTEVASKEGEITSTEANIGQKEGQIKVAEDELKKAEDEARDADTKYTRATNEENVAQLAVDTAQRFYEDAKSAADTATVRFGVALATFNAIPWIAIKPKAAAGIAVAAFGYLLDKAMRKLEKRKTELQDAKDKLEEKQDARRDAWFQVEIKENARGDQQMFLDNLKEQLEQLKKNLLQLQKQLKALKEQLEAAKEALRQCEEQKAQSDCGKDAGGGGEPHFFNWYNEWWSYHGGCDLVFLQTKLHDTNENLLIHIRTTIHDTFSYISEVSLSIGSSIFQVISNDKIQKSCSEAKLRYFLDGTENITLPSKILTYPLTISQEKDKDTFFGCSKSTVFTINLSGKDKIKISYLRGFLYVNVAASSLNFASATGLVGTWGKKGFIARDGKTIIDDPIAYAEEWQVRSGEPNLFKERKDPQHPTKCLPPPSAEATNRRRLGEDSSLRSMAEEACSTIENSMPKEMCVFDVMTMGDPNLASAPLYKSEHVDTFEDN